MEVPIQESVRKVNDILRFCKGDGLDVVTGTKQTYRYFRRFGKDEIQRRLLRFYKKILRLDITCTDFIQSYLTSQEAL